MQSAMGARSGRPLRNLFAWLTLLLLGLGVALWWSTDDVAAQEAEPVEGDVDLGGQLYAQACAQCHASDGGGATVPGTDRTAPALSGRPEITASYIDLVLRTGRMPPAGDPYDNQPRAVAFDEAQRQAVVAYVLRLPALALNGLLVASTPLDGGHYLVDVLGGLALAGGLLALARKLLPDPPFSAVEPRGGMQ
jgi:mono/diheme cytochrome c family protein